jgi:hypothetical protein
VHSGPSSHTAPGIISQRQSYSCSRAHHLPIADSRLKPVPNAHCPLACGRFSALLFDRHCPSTWEVCLYIACAKNGLRDPTDNSSEQDKRGSLEDVDVNNRGKLPTMSGCPGRGYRARLSSSGECQSAECLRSLSSRKHTTVAWLTVSTFHIMVTIRQLLHRSTMKNGRTIATVALLFITSSL